MTYCILNTVKMKSKTVIYDKHFETVAEAMHFVKDMHRKRWLNVIITILP